MDIVLTFGADNLGPVPLSIVPAADSGYVVLGEPFVTLVPHSGVNTVPGFVHTDKRGILHCWRRATEHWGQKG